tara:strand:+ start:1390 stop:1635 length:246 start_codon:yes stop_codon:yes gene_type:complete
MGRAIDMERDIDVLKIKVRSLENIVRGMTHTISDLDKTETIDEKREEKTDGKKETNNEGDDKGSVKSNKRNKSNASKSSKS